MIVNNCSAHYEIKGPKSIDLQFLPLNATICTQPMNQEAISYVDFVYNKFIFEFFRKKSSCT